MARLTFSAPLLLAALGLLGLAALASAQTCAQLSVPASGGAYDPASNFTLSLSHPSSKTDQYYLTQNRSMTVELWATVMFPSGIVMGSWPALFKARSSDSFWDLTLMVAVDPQDNFQLLLATWSGAVQITTTFKRNDVAQYVHYTLRLQYSGAGKTQYFVAVAPKGASADTIFKQSGEFSSTPGTGPVPGIEWLLPTTYPGVVARREFRVWGGALKDQAIVDNAILAFRNPPYDPKFFINLVIDNGAASQQPLGPPGSSPANNTIDGALAVVTDVGGSGGLWYPTNFCPPEWFSVPATSTLASDAFLTGTGTGAGAGTTGGAGTTTFNVNGQCFNPQGPPQYTALFDLRCPPNVTLAVKPVNVSGVPKLLCGAQMPDLRYLISADWSDPAIQISQSPAAGSFLPPGSFTGSPAATDPDWPAASPSLPQLQAPVPPEGLLASFTVNNGAGRGPNGTCTFRIVVDDKGGPPLCPGACPPRHILFPLPPSGSVCGLDPFPNLLQNFSAPRPACVAPKGWPAYEVVDSAGAAPAPTFAVQPGGDPATRYSKELLIRPVNAYAGPGSKAPACPVRVSLYYATLPAVAPNPVGTQSFGAVNSTQAAGGPPPAGFTSDVGVQVTNTPCASAISYDRGDCAHKISVEYPPEIKNRAGFQPDIDAAGNYTFGPSGPAWTRVANGNGPFSVYFGLLAQDGLLNDPNIAPNALLRTYVVGATCTFNRGLPPPAKLHVVSVPIVARVEVRKPGQGGTPPS